MINPDSILTVRKELYMKNINRDMVKKREDIMLSLRKDKLQESMMERRYTSLTQNVEDNSKFEIVPGDLSLGKDFLTTFWDDNDKLNFAKRLVSESDENLRKFGIRQLRNYTDTLDKKSKIEDSFELSFFETIVNQMINSKDLQEIFELSWVIINITKYSSKYVKTLAHSPSIIRIFELLISIDEYHIKNHFIYIFSNIVGESEETFKAVVEEVPLMSYVIDCIRKEHLLPAYFKSNLFWLLGNLIKYRDISNITASYEIFPNVFKYLKSNLDKNSFMEALFAVEKLSSHYEDDSFQLLNDYEISKILIPYITTKTDFYELKSIFKILIDMSWKDEYFISVMYKEKIFHNVESFLSESLVISQTNQNYISKHTECFKNLVICISNFAGSGTPKIKNDLIRNTKIPIYLQELMKFTSKNELKREVLMMFQNAIDTNVSKIKMELLRIKIPELFCENLKIQDSEIQKICLEGILTFLLYADEIMKSKNILKIQLQSIGAVIDIDNLQLSKDDAVAKISDYIMNKYFLN